MRLKISGGCLVLYLTLAIGELAAASTTISFVQVADATPQSHVSNVSVSYPRAQNAGDLNMIIVGWNDSSTSVRSVSDSLGNTYQLAVGPLRGTGLTQSIYYAKSIKAGSNTVTVTFNQPAAFPDLRILEYKGLSTTAPLDVSAGSHGKSGGNTLVSSGSAGTSSPNELIIGAGITNGGFSKAGGLFTSEVITRDGDIAENEIVSARGTYAATASLGNYGAQNWVMQMVAWKAGPSTGGGAPTVGSVSPNSGSSNGGSTVTITGNNFASGSSVTFGGTSASKVTVVNSSSITATIPAHAAGLVNVVVSDSNGSGTLSNGFTYTAPGGVQHKVVLSWHASSSANITNYNVYRSTISGGYYGLIGTTAGILSYTDQTVSSGKTYYYVTTAVDKQGVQSSYSHQVIATVPSP